MARADQCGHSMSFHAHFRRQFHFEPCHMKGKGPE